MAQYYQVTSLEELHRLYPNLQIDNIEGIPCMIQDDQVTQFTDGQAQQVIATVEQSSMQLSQSPGVSQQCSPQQSQYVVHQPTQYVIQQMDTNESQAPTIQYIQQRPVVQNKEEISEGQLKDQNVSCTTTEIGSEEHSLHQCVVKQNGSQQFLSQVQPIMHQPIQIHQQIQAVDMGANILVLQNQEQQDLFINSSKSQEIITSPDKQQQQQQIIIQRHQDQQLVAQREQLVEKSDNTKEYTPQQILQSRRSSQGGIQPPPPPPQQQQQQQQQLHHLQQPLIQNVRYYNQVTVLDGFSEPNVPVEHHAPTNENVGQQPQIRPQIQQYRGKKPPQNTGPSTVIQQPQQVLIPQRFEMSSPPAGARISQIRKKGPQQDVETSPPPVFIVQKLDSPFLVRQPQAKIRFQGPGGNNDTVHENSYQSISTQSNLNLEIVEQENQPMTQSPLRSGQLIEVQQKNVVAGQPLQVNKFPPDRNQPCGQIRIGIVEQPFRNTVTEPLNKIKVATPVSTKPAVARIKTTEQQTEPMSDVKEPGIQFQRWVTNYQPQTQPTTTVPSQMQSPTQLQPPAQNQIQTPGRGRGARGQVSPRGGHQYVPKARGVQVQTSPPRLPNAEGGCVGRRLKSPRGGGKGGRGGWNPCGVDQRQPAPVRLGTPPVVQNSNTKGESSQTPNENTEEARMVVLLLNGEKKLFKIPCSQNILLGQILQQAGIVATPTTSLTIEPVDGNSDHFVIKSSAGGSQTLTPFKPTNITQAVNVATTIGTPRSLVATIQQRPRGHSPALPQSSSVGLIRHRLHFAHPRISSPSSSTPPTLTSNIVTDATSQNSQNSTPPPQPPKEEPRFVSGYMAICPFCGISSLDFNKCIRCRRKLPENVKSQSIFSAKKKKTDKAGNEKNSEDCKSESEEKQSDLSGLDAKGKISPLQGCEKKKLKPCLKKKKISDEPAEILILSSDDEEDTRPKKLNTNTPALSVLRKEPVYTFTLTEADMTNSLKEGKLNEDLMKNIQPGSFTTLQCRTVRVGSYKVQPKERILISTKAIKIVVNSLKNESATIVIPISDILKALIHFGKQIPVVFIYPTPKVGFQIRNILGMENKMGPYYDPTSTQEETHKRITLLLEKFTEDNKIALHKIFGHSKIEELSEKEANEILVRASPLDTHNAGVGKPLDTVRKIMVYPPPPEKGGITLNNQDYACLGEDQFLNDVIIDFYLKYLLLKVLSPADRNRTHVFSTFFYKRLTTKPKTLRKNDPENDPKLSPAEKRHMRVKGWTKQVNLFEKDFIIVPINEHSHWFLAIICFPGLTGPVRFSDNTPVEPEEVIPKKTTQTVQIGNTTITHIIKTDGNTISLQMDSGSDRDEAEGDQDDLHPSSDDEGSEQAEDESNTSSQSVQIPLLTPTPVAQSPVKEAKSKLVKRKAFKEPIKQPCILIFDSLAGASRVRVVATLRDYLKIEYKKKMGQERDFSKDTIKGAVPKVPQQNNFTDCGLYVLQYVESFFQDPLHDFKLPLKYLQDWFPEDVVSSKRQKLASLIRSLMEEQGISVEEMGLPVLTFTNGSNPPDDQSRMEDEEMEDEEEMNEEEEEMLRDRVQISEFENEDDEDMNLDEEEEMDEEEDDDEIDDEDEEEELEVGEIPRQWLARASGTCNELESSIGGQMVLKTSPFVNSDPSDSDEEGHILSQNSEFTGDEQTVQTEILEERDSDQMVISESRKSVPLTEFQDFESQISCTTIERNLDGKNSGSDMLTSDEEEGEEEEEDEEGDQCSGVMEEENTSQYKAIGVGENFDESLERKSIRSNEVLVSDGKGTEVTNMIKKLVNDKNITINRKEEESSGKLSKKQLDIKKLKVKDCDKGEESKKGTSSYLPQKNSLGACKRSFQALKNVRIQKKTERKLELCSKRQKVEER